MRADVSRLGAAACAALCCAALLLAAAPVRTARAQTARPAPAAKSPLPPPVGFVKDEANVIDARTERLLQTRLKLLKARSRIEMAVATVVTTGGQDIFDYSLAVARGWGIGPPAGEEGGGILLLVAVKDRKWRVQVSRGLEADLPPDVTGEVGRLMTPSLRAGHYGEGITKCVDGLIQRLAERRGFSMEEGELILQGLPERKPKGVNRKP